MPHDPSIPQSPLSPDPLRPAAVLQVLVIGTGITLHNALTAAEHLASIGVHVRVLDPFTIKPLDVATIRDNAKQCGGRVLTVEDHYPAGKSRRDGIRREVG